MIILPSNLKIIESEAFMGCSSLDGELLVPNGLGTIGPAAFAGCYGIDSARAIDMPTPEDENT